MTTTQRRSTTARGLGWQHQQQVDRLKRRHTDGTPCWWCGKPTWLDRTRNWDYNPNSTDRASGSLSGDHTQTRAHGGTKTDRLLHGTCNKQRGDGTRDHLRPALTGQPWGSAPTDNRAAWCRLDW